MVGTDKCVLVSNNEICSTMILEKDGWMSTNMMKNKEVVYIVGAHWCPNYSSNWMTYAQMCINVMFA